MKYDLKGIIGKCESGEFYTENGEQYDLTQDGEGQLYLHCVGSGSTKSKVKPLSARDKREITKAYPTEGMNYCEDCSTAWDSSDLDYPNASHRIITRHRKDGHSWCEIYCTECVPVECMVSEFKKPEDLFKAPDSQGINLDEHYTEIDELFCDSSGMGHSGESAMTKTAAYQQAAEILKKHKRSRLFVALTGCGQFQVYVGVFTKKRKAAA